MASYTEVIKLSTKPNETHVITDQIKTIITNSNIKSGICMIFNSGSTGAILINENDPMIFQDIKDSLEIVAPESKIYHHPENGQSYIKSALMGTAKTIPVEDSIPIIGERRDIFFFEFDVKEREREIIVTVVGD